jgi:RNA polymerase sigma factor (sigma-70 family)
MAQTCDGSMAKHAMSESGSVSVWIEQLKTGDQQAAQLIWERYYYRLVALARKKLGSSPRLANDEDDVVQSAFKSFCLRAQAGQFPDLRDRANLWPLLVLITARKAANQRVHERRAKRGGGKTTNLSQADPSNSTDLGFAAAIADEPSPSEAAIFLAELDRIMDSLDDPSHRLILLWKLEDRTNREIASHLDCSLSAVERKLRLIRRRLDKDLASPQPGDAT